MVWRILIMLVAASIPARGDAQVLTVCWEGGPGNTKQAVPVLDKFLRHLEKTGGIAARAITGEYHTTRAGCLAHVKRTAPLLGVFDLNSFLREEKSLKLVPVGRMGSATGKKYHLLVREGTFKDLASLKGKTLISSHVADPRFVSRIIFDGKIDAARHFTLKFTRRPLKGIRRVARGRADATLVDNLAYKHLSRLQLPVKLVSIHSSAGMPDLTMVALGGRGKNPVVNKIRKILALLCNGPGQALCKTFGISKFGTVKASQYRTLSRKYNAP